MVVLRLIKHIRDNIYLDIWVIFFFFLAFFIEPIIGLISGNGFIFNPLEQVFKGYVNIIKSPSILITDYVYVGGLGATFFNVASILLINLFLVKRLKIRMTGPVYAGLVMICGFSFFGKNIFNTLPIYLGIFLFSIFKRIPFKSFIITILFSTGISPIVSYCFFGFGFEYYKGIPLGIIVGVIVGFVLPAISSHTIIFHEGYNLYNTGFALGIISLVFYAVFKYCGLEVILASDYDYTTTNVFYLILPIMSFISIGVAFINDYKVFNKYLALMKTHGRLISDYVHDFSKETVLFNFGVIGLLLSIIGIIFKIPMNGVVFGSCLSILGFAGFGMHIKNLLPVWVGCFISIYVGMLITGNYDLSISTIIAFIFASGLAPVCGKFGIIFGLVAGVLHIIITPIMINMHGGFDLYNNGFSAGFTAMILCVVAEKILKKEKKKDVSRRKSKDL